MASTLDTAVYIDGYNLYYGRIRGTAYKWLDPVLLFDHVLRQQEPDARLRAVRYFGAMALGRFAQHGAASVKAQQDLLRALQQRHPERFQLILGRHTYNPTGTWLPRHVAGQAFDRNDKTCVWKIEEKQTDVNIALAMYQDARAKRFRQLVLVSNDSDVAPALAAIRADFPAIRIGLVTPRHPASDDRVTSRSLGQHAHWVRRHLRDEELQAAQLPERVATRKQPIRKPAHW